MARNSSTKRADDGDPAGAPPSESTLVVMTAPDRGVRATAEGVYSVAGADVSGLADMLAEAHLTLQPMFDVPLERPGERFAAAAPGTDLGGGASADSGGPDLSTYYSVSGAQDDLEAMAERLIQLPEVEAAYVKPGAEPAATKTATRTAARSGTDDLSVVPSQGGPATGDFTARQGYLGAPPAGVNGLWAHTQAGGDGAGTKVIDVEGAWRFSHEDLLANATGVVVGAPSTDIRWRNHGTAVLGEISGDANGVGVMGLAPAAVVGGASIFGGTGSAGAIQQAADKLSAGDIMLIELHAPGPRHNFQSRDDQAGYIAMEWWPDDFAALSYARSRGIVVVEAAGNGGENLDDPLYDIRPAGFPTTWRNPFNTANPGCGAVMCGAGAPPPGTHGRDHGPDRSRLGFSNHGRRVDVQGWGREVTTTGGRHDQPGDLQGGGNEDVWYTDTFSGTSSASPIVVGALAEIQGMLRARGLALLTPAAAVQVLRATGSPQQDAPGRPATQRIGNRPDVQAAMAYLTPAQVQSGVATQYWDEAVPIPAGPPRLWLFVDGAWRMRAGVTAAERDLVQRAFLGADSTVRVWFTGTDVVGLVISGS